MTIAEIIKIQIIAKKITLRDDDNLQKILENNGIYPDGESIGVVYYLNPDIDVELMKAGNVIAVPSATIKREPMGDEENYGMVSLTVDNDLI